MKKGNWKTYALWISLSEGVGALAGLLTRESVKIFNETVLQPPLSPPSWVFPIVWGILYALMGISAGRIAMTENRPGLNLFIIQLIVNFFWSLLFFIAAAYAFSTIWLVLLWWLVAMMILAFRQADPLSAWLQVPYLLWLTFALYLNVGVWLLNR